MTYLLWKLLHIVGVVLFLGNITTGLFWAAQAHRQRDFRQIASTFAGISRSDGWFTTPGVFVILIGGIGAAASAGMPLLRTGWILWSLILFAISGIIFMARVAPLQRRISYFAGTTPQTDESWHDYLALYKRWKLTGFLSWLAPVIALVLMVLKPPLPAL